MNIETVYDLVVNVRHEGNAEKGVYVADVYNKVVFYSRTAFLKTIKIFTFTTSTFSST